MSKRHNYNSREKVIYKWMIENVENFRDRKTGEINCTKMVEAWDDEEGDGTETLDELHPAWDIAVDVAEECE